MEQYFMAIKNHLLNLRNGSKQKERAPCGVDWATSMASSWMENPTDKDRLLLKHQR